MRAGRAIKARMQEKARAQQATTEMQLHALLTSVGGLTQAMRVMDDTQRGQNLSLEILVSDATTRAEGYAHNLEKMVEEAIRRIGRA